MLCGRLHCQKRFNLIIFFYKIQDSRLVPGGSVFRRRLVQNGAKSERDRRCEPGGLLS